MSVLDLRTRTSADIRHIDARDFFSRELPVLMRERCELAVPFARSAAMRSLAIATTDCTYTLEFANNRLTVGEAERGVAMLRVDDIEFVRMLNDLTTPACWRTGSAVKFERGDLRDMENWWVVLRALIDGRRAHVAGAVEFRDRNGAPLDLTRSFTPDDDDADIAHFLKEAGFLHLVGFDHETPDEAEIMEAVEVRALARLGVADPYVGAELLR